MFYHKKSNQLNGRSMLEMLGVLAIIAILSVVGLSGFQMAMDYYKANETIYDSLLRATNIPMMYDDYDNKSVWAEKEFKFDEMGALKNKNPIGYSVFVMGEPASSDYLFRVEVSGLKKEVCQRIINMNPTVISLIKAGASIPNRNTPNSTVNDCIANGNLYLFFDEGLEYITPCTSTDECGTNQTCSNGVCQNTGDGDPDKCTGQPTSCPTCQTIVVVGGCNTCQADTTTHACVCPNEPAECTGCDVEGQTELGCRTCTPMDTTSCGTCKEWDSSVCRCIDSTAHECVCPNEPTCSGCQTQDVDANGCRTCTEPNRTCPSGQSWDEGTCSCKEITCDAAAGLIKCGSDCCCDTAGGWNIRADGNGCIKCVAPFVFDGANDCICPEQTCTKEGTTGEWCCPNDQECASSAGQCCVGASCCDSSRGSAYEYDGEDGKTIFGRCCPEGTVSARYSTFIKYDTSRTATFYQYKCCAGEVTIKCTCDCSDSPIGDYDCYDVCVANQGSCAGGPFGKAFRQSFNCSTGWID